MPFELSLIDLVSPYVLQGDTFGAWHAALSILRVAEHEIGSDESGVTIRGVVEFEGNLSLDPANMSITAANAENHPQNDSSRRDPWLDIRDAKLDDPRQLQAIGDGLSPEKIEALLRKWPRLPPHPYSAGDRKAGYRYQISILQAEFSLTQVLDRPVTGRVFFEEVIRENLGIGRPSQVQLIIDRRVSRRTPGKFRTRVITDGVVPSLHVDYKNTRIKQYPKEGRALRTETTINNTRDFGIGKLLKNLPALRPAGFPANRRLLGVQKLSHDCSIGEDAFDRVVRPTKVEGQRASALRCGDTRAQALFAVLVVFSLQLRGFTNPEMRALLAQLLGLDPANYPVGRMTYDLRRLRLHGSIERIPRRHSPPHCAQHSTA